MSRIGKKTIPVPAGVKLTINPGSVELSGPKGNIKQIFPSKIKVEFDEKEKMIKVTRPNDEKESKAMHGLTRALVANAVAGVVKPFSKTLDIIGTGYNAKLKEKTLELNLGFCLPKYINIPEGIKVTLPTPLRIVIEGCDKYIVGQFASDVRGIRPPDHYKGKGIRYEGEKVKIKAGKTFAGAS